MTSIPPRPRTSPEPRTDAFDVELFDQGTGSHVAMQVPAPRSWPRRTVARLAFWLLTWATEVEEQP